MEVIKRDGTKAKFDASKIRKAIEGANSRSNEMSQQDIDRIAELAAKALRQAIEYVG